MVTLLLTRHHVRNWQNFCGTHRLALRSMRPTGGDMGSIRWQPHNSQAHLRVHFLYMYINSKPLNTISGVHYCLLMQVCPLMS